MNKHQNSLGEVLIFQRRSDSREFSEISSWTFRNGLSVRNDPRVDNDNARQP